MIIAILILATLGRIIGLNQSFWLDEAAQVIESARPLSQQLDISVDFWPPLYHVLLHFWMYIGKSEVWVRLLSVILSVLTVLTLYLLAKELLNRKVALLSAVLLAIAPFHIWYAQEARPYTLSAFLGLLTTHFLIKKQTVGYIISGIFFTYSSYLAVFLFIAHGIFIYLYERKILSAWLKEITIIGLAFIPWLPHLFKQLTIGKGLITTLPGWSEAVSVPIYKVLPLTFTKFILGRISFDNKIFYGFLVTSLFLIISYVVIHAYNKHRQLVIKLGILFFLPIVGAFLFSFFLPILAPQRMLYALPLFYLLLTVGISALKKFQIIFITLIVIVSFYSLYLYNANPRFQREQWRQAVTHVENNRTADSLVLFVFPEPFAPWQWYSHGVVDYLAVAPTLSAKDENLIQFGPRIQNFNRIFYFHYLTGLTDPQRKTQQFLKSSGFIEIATKDFPGVGFITIYEKALADI